MSAPAFIKRLSQDILDGTAAASAAVADAAVTTARAPFSVASAATVAVASAVVKRPLNAAAKQFSGNPDDKFVTLGRGTGGIDELATKLDESSVVWGLVRVTVGSGSMARDKYVFLYFSGSKCPLVRRMRYTERRGAAVQALGGGGMIDWDREFVADVTLDEMLHKVLASVVADDGGAKMSVASLRAAALEQIKKAAEKPRPVRRRSLAEKCGAPGRAPRTALALRASLKLQQVQAMMRDGNGINWLLVTPALELVEAGGGSIPEMRGFLKEDEVGFALVRMGFGSGRFRRNHYVTAAGLRVRPAGCVRVARVR